MNTPLPTDVLDNRNVPLSRLARENDDALDAALARIVPGERKRVEVASFNSAI